MRGLYTASLLKSISDQFNESSPKDIGKGFDLIVGTSTGGIIATGFFAGINLEKIIDIYAKQGKNIFINPTPQNKLKFLFWVLRCFCSSANSNTKLRSTLEEIFGDKTVLDAYSERNIGLCLTSVNISNGMPRVFKTPHDPRRNADDKRTLVDICLATSAAPIIFPIASIREPNNETLREGFVDGGLWANNPILIGIIEALRISKKYQPVEIISVGTCPPIAGHKFNEEGERQGIRYWQAGIRALDISMYAQSKGFNFMCDFLVESLQKLGKEITVFRLEGKPLSKMQEQCIGLDVVTEEACEILMRAGNTDGQQIYGKALRNLNDKKLKMLSNIFKNLPNF